MPSEAMRKSTRLSVIASVKTSTKAWSGLGLGLRLGLGSGLGLGLGLRENIDEGLARRTQGEVM